MIQVLQTTYQTRNAVVIMLFMTALFCHPTTAQEITYAPPPVRRITAEEQTQLDGAKDFRARARTILELAAQRLTDAEQATDTDNFIRASQNIGAYQFLLDTAAALTRDDSQAGGRARETFKFLEKNLRPQLARVEALRRRTPSAYGVHLAATAELVRRVRTQALNRFFGTDYLEDVPDRGRQAEEKPAPPLID